MSFDLILDFDCHCTNNNFEKYSDKIYIISNLYVYISEFNDSCS